MYQKIEILSGHYFFIFYGLEQTDKLVIDLLHQVQNYPKTCCPRTIITIDFFSGLPSWFGIWNKSQSNQNWSREHSHVWKRFDRKPSWPSNHWWVFKAKCNIWYILMHHIFLNRLIMNDIFVEICFGDLITPFKNSIEKSFI